MHPELRQSPQSEVILSVFVKKLIRNVRDTLFPKSEALPDWFEHLARTLRSDSSWKHAKEAARNGPKVLMATSVGGHSPVVALDSLLAVALTLRGAEVHLLLCDKVLQACERCLVTSFPDQTAFVEHGPSEKLCEGCFTAGARVFETLGLTLHRYSQFVSPDELETARELSAELPVEQMVAYTSNGMAVGEHALAGTLRYFSRGNLDSEPHGEETLRRYFHASLTTTYVLSRMFQTLKFRSASFHHGIYVPQGLVGESARKHGVRVANWQVAYRKRRFIFSHGDTYHRTLLSEPTDTWETIPWTDELERQTMDYLKSRWKGTRDWIWFHEDPQENVSQITKELGIDASRPCIGLLTNVIWDAQLHYRTNAFESMLDWALQTVEYFSTRPDLQLIIRIHPAEVRGAIPSRQPMADELKKAFPVLPSNVFLITPESQVSTYAILEVCNAAIIYGTKTGVELTSVGIPVIVAGEAWIRNKGLTLDAASPPEYFDILNRLPFQGSMEESQVRKARTYAYHFFFRRMIPVECMEPIEGWPPYRPMVNTLDEIRPGLQPGLDTICTGILDGTDFVYPAEMYDEASD